MSGRMELGVAFIGSSLFLIINTKLVTMNLLDTNSKIAISPIKDPFKKEGVSEIWTYIKKDIFSKKWQFNGWITFKNGSTEGKQEFSEDSFEDLIKAMKEVLDNI